MTKVRQISLILFLIFATSILFSVVGARSVLIATADSMTMALLFINPDGTTCQQPCLLGIRPGETSLEKAGEIIKVHRFMRYFKPMDRSRTFVTANVKTVIYESVTNDMEIVIYGNTFDGYVDRIKMIVKVESPIEWANLGQMIAYLGDPTQVEIANTSIRCSYFAGHTTFVHTYATLGYIGLNDALEYITVSEQTPYQSLSWSPVELIRWKDWQGFARVSRYLQPYLP